MLQEIKRSKLKMADQPQNVNFQDARATHDCLKRPTDLPLFHADKARLSSPGPSSLSGHSQHHHLGRQAKVPGAGQHPLTLSPILAGQLGHLPSQQGEQE
jgi:hypothetical protein